LMFAQTSWAMLGLAVFWSVPGAFAVRWGVGGARSFVAVTAENLIIRNALRTHTYPWSHVQSIEVVPRSPDPQATTQAAVRLKDGRMVRMCCTALVGWVWNGGERWQSGSDFTERLGAERHRLPTVARRP
jgi:hypothetical protein